MSLGKRIIDSGAEAAINPRDHFSTVTYNGTGSSQSTNSLSSQSGSVLFQPDFIWFKARSHAYLHQLYDSVRGVDKFLNTGSGGVGSRTGTEAEFDDSGNDLMSFDSNGFTVGASAFGSVNENGFSNLAWNWKGGGAPTATNSASAGAVPTSGSVMIDGVASTANLAGAVAVKKLSANTKAGFSIVRWISDGGSTATTKAHGLNQAPNFLIIKPSNATNIWQIQHTDLPSSKYLAFTTDALSPDGGVTYFTTSSTTFGFRDGSNAAAGAEMIAYLFHDVPFYQKFGTYVGNGGTKRVYVDSNGDGTGTGGFLPTWVMVKNTASGYSWIVTDSTRGNNALIYLNFTLAEQAQTGISSFNSDGFTVNTDTSFNNNGDTFIYWAIA